MLEPEWIFSTSLPSVWRHCHQRLRNHHLTNSLPGTRLEEAEQTRSFRYKINQSVYHGEAGIPAFVEQVRVTTLELLLAAMNKEASDDEDEEDESGDGDDRDDDGEVTIIKQGLARQEIRGLGCC